MPETVENRLLGLSESFAEIVAKVGDLAVTMKRVVEAFGIIKKKVERLEDFADDIAKKEKERHGGNGSP